MTWHCPACGRPVLNPEELCGGSFLEREHPSAVVAVEDEPSAEGFDGEAERQFDAGFENGEQ
jgi:hypothetical protein